MFYALCVSRRNTGLHRRTRPAGDAGLDLAELYQVETRTLKQAVRRNIERFPSDFMFEITESEYNYLKNSMTSQIVISNERGGRRYMPFAFTEQGVAMLSSVLRSETAIQVNIAIMRAFVAMRSRY